MKKLLLSLFAICLFSFAAIRPAHAGSIGGVAVRYLYSTGTVTGATWVPLVTTTARAIKGIAMSNVSLDPLYLGVASSGSAAESEVAQIIIPAGATTFMPLPISQAQRISVKSAGRALSYGELQLNFFYY